MIGDSQEGQIGWREGLLQFKRTGGDGEDMLG